jgi:hypothetical protein
VWLGNGGRQAAGQRHAVAPQQLHLKAATASGGAAAAAAAAAARSAETCSSVCAADAGVLCCQLALTHALPLLLMLLGVVVLLELLLQGRQLWELGQATTGRCRRHLCRATRRVDTGAVASTVPPRSHKHASAGAAPGNARHAAALPRHGRPRRQQKPSGGRRALHGGVGGVTWCHASLGAEHPGGLVVW